MGRSLPERRATAALVSLALAAAPGCHDSEVWPPPLPAHDYFFLVTLDAGQEVTSVSAPYGVSPSGGLAFGGATNLPLRDADRVVFVVGVDADALAAIHPGFDRARDRELQLITALASAPLRIDRLRVEAALPAGATVGEVTSLLDDASRAQVVAALRAGLRLVVPFDADYCRLPSEIELVPFGDTEDLLPASRTLPFEIPGTGSPSGWHDILDVEHLTRDRAVFITRYAVGIAERGRPVSVAPFDPTRPAGLLPMSSAVGAPVELTRMSLVPGPAGGERRLLVAGARDERPAVFELSIDASGVRFVASATLPPELRAIEEPLRDVRVDPDGHAIAVGALGMLLRRASGERAFRPLPPISALISDTFRRVILTGDPARPHLIAEDAGWLFLGDAVSGDYTRFRRSDRLNDRRYYGLAAAPDARELWAVGPKGTLFRRTDDLGWHAPEVRPPPSFAPCASATGPEELPVMTETMEDVYVDARAAYLLLSDCTAMVRVRRSDRCVSVIPMRGRPIGVADGGYRALDALDGQLIMAGNDGALLSVDLSRIP